jgi:hypothetical protein
MPSGSCKPRSYPRSKDPRPRPGPLIDADGTLMEQPSSFLIDNRVSGCLVLARRAAQELSVCVRHRLRGDHPNTPKSPEGGSLG